MATNEDIHGLQEIFRNTGADACLQVHRQPWVPQPIRNNSPDLLQKLQIINRILGRLADCMTLKTFSDCRRCQYLDTCDAHITGGNHKHSAGPDTCELDLRQMPGPLQHKFPDVKNGNFLFYSRRNTNYRNPRPLR